MFIIRIIIFVIVFTIYGLNAGNNESILDSYHDDLCLWLVDTSNSIDDYFIDMNSTLRSDTQAELKTSFAVESGQKSEYAMRLKLRLNLPKIQKKLRLILEDEDSDDLLYDDTVLNNNHQLEKKNYFLRIEYFNYMLKELNIASGVGVRFRKQSLHPYLNLKAKYYFEDRVEYQSLISNRFRLYIDGDIENIIGYDILQYIEKDFYISFRNTFGYKSTEDYQKMVNDLSIIKPYNEKKRVILGVSLFTEIRDEDITVVYPQLYGIYRNQLYKDWIYYELNPSLLARSENNDELSIRFMINIGTVFRTN